MDAKYLAEIKARLDAGRLPMKSDMEALLAEVERLTTENESLAVNGGKYIEIAQKRYEMLEKASKRAEDAEIEKSAYKEAISSQQNEITVLMESNTAKDQQIATLKKALEIASMEVNVAFETLESHHVITMERKASGTQENIDAWIQKAKQAQEQEAEE